MTDIERELIEALHNMLELFDHCGLNGLMLSAKRHGWTQADVAKRMSACKAAHTVIARVEA